MQTKSKRIFPQTLFLHLSKIKSIKTNRISYIIYFIAGIIPPPQPFVSAQWPLTLFCCFRSLFYWTPTELLQPASQSPLLPVHRIPPWQPPQSMQCSSPNSCQDQAGRGGNTSFWLFNQKKLLSQLKNPTELINLSPDNDHKHWVREGHSQQSKDRVSRTRVRVRCATLTPPMDIHIQQVESHFF